MLTLPAFPVSVLGTVVNKRAKYSYLRKVAPSEQLKYRSATLNELHHTALTIVGIPHPINFRGILSKDIARTPHYQLQVLIVLRLLHMNIQHTYQESHAAGLAWLWSPALWSCGPCIYAVASSC